jgi:pyrroline-5-carboxylate reductase
LPFGTLIVSFLAGTTLAALASVVSAGDIVRVVPSSPDTIVKRTAIAGVFPAGNFIVEELLRGLSIRQLYLAREEDMHAFTALGLCLPMALVCWSARGNTVDDANLKDCAKRYGLGNYDSILEWAHKAEPRLESDSEREAYLRRAAAPGGVTEAILARINAGGSLADALESGVSRSVELSTCSVGG